MVVNLPWLCWDWGAYNSMIIATAEHLVTIVRHVNDLTTSTRRNKMSGRLKGRNNNCL